MARKRWSIDPFVFLFESPSPLDVLDGRTEGEALSAALGLAGIKNRLFRPFNKEMLARALTKALDEIEPPPPGQGDTVFLPSFHFSAHGNKDGLEFTSGETITWTELRKVLIAVAKSIGLFDPNGKYALLKLTLSTCWGASASQMFSHRPPYPCMFTVGPVEEVHWPDALTAFVVFYHLMLHKKSEIREAVAAMNRAAGLTDLFRYEMNPAALPKQ